MIEFQSVSKKYSDSAGTLALADVSLNIAKGELVYLAGPSGAGKSTLMKMVAAIERPTTGRVIVNGQDVGRIRKAGIPFLRRNLGLIFQNQRLLNDRHILANVMLPLLVTGAHAAQAEQRARAALDKVGLLDRAAADKVIDALHAFHSVGVTCVISSHDDEILDKAARVIRLEHGHVTGGGA